MTRYNYMSQSPPMGKRATHGEANGAFRHFRKRTQASTTGPPSALAGSRSVHHRERITSSARQRDVFHLADFFVNVSNPRKRERERERERPRTPPSHLSRDERTPRVLPTFTRHHLALPPSTPGRGSRGRFSAGETLLLSRTCAGRECVSRLFFSFFSFFFFVSFTRATEVQNSRWKMEMPGRLRRFFLVASLPRLIS